jgi:hypothetical protein
MSNPFVEGHGTQGTLPPDGEMVFEGTGPFAVRRRRSPLLRTALIILPIVLAVTIIFASQSGVPAALLAAARGQPVAFTVLSDVPWARLRVDDAPQSLAFRQDSEHLYPVAVIKLTTGNHTLTITADGFLPLTAHVVAGANVLNQLVAHPRLTAEGKQAALDAINRVLQDSPYAQAIQLDAAAWPALGLQAKPAATTLTSEQHFEATGLDLHQPTYFQSSYLRPITPAGPGSMGVAVVVVEVASVYSECAQSPLVLRSVPVMSARSTEVIFSLVRDAHGWHAFAPYALTPGAGLYTPPDLATLRSTDDTLRTLAARTALAAALGDKSALAAAVSIRSLSIAGTEAGIILSLDSTTPSSGKDAAWLFTADALSALTPEALRYTPGLALLPAAVRAQLARGGLPAATAEC